MKKLHTILIGIFLSLVSCTDFTDIDPKGKNILNTVDDLDLVLNYQYSLSIYNYVINMMNDIYPQMTNIPDLVNQSPRTLRSIYVSWDETSDRESLTTSDEIYTGLYKIIGQVSNPVLLNIDNADGDRKKANRLKAEALVLRGWCHYLLVNIYAKAYDPTTAATDPGIVYAIETEAVETPNEKLTVAQIYENILSDVNAALELGSLSTSPSKMRIGQAFAYAVKAKVLMSMHDYDGALKAATASLKVKNTMDNYNDLVIPEVTYGTGISEFTHPYLELNEELFDTPVLFFYEAFTTDLWNAFEEGHIVKEYALTDTRLYGMNMFGSSFYGLNIPMMISMNMYYSPIGLTTVDMYLTQAECYIREGNLTEAMNTLNNIRQHRIITSKYADLSASTPEAAITILKNIYRTENYATLKNFIDLKRWNTDATFQATLYKSISYTANGETKNFSAELTPDSPLWILPFPQNATDYNPNLTQNY